MSGWGIAKKKCSFTYLFLKLLFLIYFKECLKRYNEKEYKNKNKSGM